MINMECLTPSQRRCLQLMKASEVRRILWMGSVRSGKGVGSATALIVRAVKRALEKEGNNVHIVAGATSGSFIRNNAQYLEDAAQQCGLRLVPVGGSVPGWDLGPGIARFHLFGGANARSYAPVRGITADTCWLDEGVLLHESFVQTCEERLSFDGSMIVITSNTDTPTHWLKKSWIDNALPGTAFINSSITENPFYSDERREHLLAQNPHTANYRRALLNEWASNEGLVYPVPDSAIVDQYHGPYAGTVVVDPGTAGTTAALLFVRWGAGWLCADEYYSVGSLEGRLPESEHWQRMLRRWQIRKVIVDPAAASFRQVVVATGRHAYPADNNFDKGVQVVNNVLYNGRLKIHRQCVNLLEEAATLQWNVALNQPRPGPDHAADCLRYGAVDLYPTATVSLLSR